MKHLLLKLCWGLCKLLKANGHQLPIHQNKSSYTTRSKPELLESTIKTASTTPTKEGKGDMSSLPNKITTEGLLAGWQQAFQSFVLSQGLILVSDRGSPWRAPGRFHATLSFLASLPGANSLLLSRLAVRQMCELLLGSAAGR